MGQISADQLYDPYGQVIDDNGTWLGSFGFAGEQTDESGLGYNRARYYHPAMGAFASLDPFEGVEDVPMSMNGYAYAHGDPVNNTDPSGAIIEWLEDRINDVGNGIVGLVRWYRDSHNWSYFDPERPDVLNCVTLMSVMPIDQPDCVDRHTYEQRWNAWFCLPREVTESRGFREATKGLREGVEKLSGAIDRTNRSIANERWLDAMIGAWDILSGGSIYEFREGILTFDDARALEGAIGIGFALYGGYQTYSNIRSRFVNSFSQPSSSKYVDVDEHGWITVKTADGEYVRYKPNPDGSVTLEDGRVLSRQGGGKLNPSVWRGKVTIANGDLKKGWIHIDARHITGNHPQGAGKLFKPGTTREQILQAANRVVQKVDVFLHLTHVQSRPLKRK